MRKIIKGNDVEKPVRKNLRKKGYDYSQPGCYFLTICCKTRGNILGIVKDGKVELNDIGKTVHSCLADTYRIRRETVEIVAGVIMPDHIHILLFILKKEQTNCLEKEDPKLATDNGNSIQSSDNAKSNGKLKCPPKSVCSLVRGFKASVSIALGYSIWQRSFNDEIITTQEHYNNVIKYIQENPTQWQYKYNTDNNADSNPA